MRVGEYEVVEGLLYSKEHEWVRVTGSKGVVGITDYAVKSLHDVVYVSLPEVGLEVEQMGLLGTVESIKAVADMYSPVVGKVTKTNAELSTKPELVNQSPYQEGWIVELELRDIEADRRKLMDHNAYTAYIKELIEKL